MTTGPRSKRLSVCLFWMHPLVAAEFQRALSGDEIDLVDHRVVRDTCARAADLLPEAPDLCVVDSDCRHPISEELVLAILAARPRTRIVVLAEEFDDETAFHLLRFGVKGLLSYHEVRTSLSRTLREVSSGGFWVTRALLARFVDASLTSAAFRRPPRGAARLTVRERQVFEDILLNLSNKEIAKTRRMSVRTAQFHVSNVLSKFGVKRRADLHLVPGRS